jgi:hypothetical protein
VPPPTPPTLPLAESTVTRAREAAPAPATETAPGVELGVRGIFHRGTVPAVLAGRATERARIASFIRDRVAAGTAGALYVSGSPGTGKTALIDDVLRHLCAEGLVRRPSSATGRTTSVLTDATWGPQRTRAAVVQVNCMRLANARGVLPLLAEELAVADAADAKAALQARLTDPAQPMAYACAAAAAANARTDAVNAVDGQGGGPRRDRPLVGARPGRAVPSL